MRLIGNGSYGTVYDHNGNAIKVISDFKDTHVSSIGELSILKYVNHPNIVSIKDFTLIESKMEIVMEKADTNLLQLKVNKRKRPYIIYQILNGLSYLHSLGITHCDIKPDNILIFGNIVKLCDFGLSKIDDLNEYLILGTPGYKAPEIFLCPEKCDSSIDLWSVGVILYEMITGHRLCLKCNDDCEDKDDCEKHQLMGIFDTLGTPTEKNWKGITLLLEKFKEKHGPIPEYNSDNIYEDLIPILGEERDLLLNLLTWPENRINIQDALKHPYFSSLNKWLYQPRNIYNTIYIKPLFTSLEKIKIKKRFILFEWLWEVSNKTIPYHFSSLLMAYKIFDYYYENNDPPINLLQLIGMICFHISCVILQKYDSGRLMNQLIYFSAKTYNTTQYQEMVVTILKYFNGDLLPFKIDIEFPSELRELIVCIITYYELSKSMSIEEIIDLAKKVKNGDSDTLSEYIKKMKKCLLKDKLKD